MKENIDLLRNDNALVVTNKVNFIFGIIKNNLRSSYVVVEK